MPLGCPGFKECNERSYRGKSPLVAAEMFSAFQAGGSQDLQRTYNDVSGGGGDDFVDAFRDAASFHLGLVARAIGFDPETPIAGGAAFSIGVTGIVGDMCMCAANDNAPPRMRHAA